jgi:hypothetical protein
VFRYYCRHDNMKLADGATRPLGVSISTSILDRVVWGLAARAFAAPTFLARLLDTQDELAGPQARLDSLERQRAEAARAEANLGKHLARLDPDAPADAAIAAIVRQQLRETVMATQGLAEALEAAQAELVGAQERRATLTAFRAFAAQQHGRLDSLTPVERRAILLALRVRVRVAPSDAPTRVWVTFDLRYLPGAAEALTADARAASDRPRLWLDFSLDAPIWAYTEQALVSEQAEAVEALSLPPMTPRDWQCAGFRDEADFEAYEQANAPRLRAISADPDDTRGMSDMRGSRRRTWPRSCART